MQGPCNLVITNGRVFDGTGAPAGTRHLKISNGLVTEIRNTPFPDLPTADHRNGSGETEGTNRSQIRVIDATGKWVMPGFVDTHTHYDAEVIASPGLNESVRHGVTTVLTGSCSLSMIYSSPLDCADLFARVEALPYDPVLEILEREKSWAEPEGWIRHLESIPLGPNVASILGHSDLRAHVMGLERSTSGEKPSREERTRMLTLLDQSLDAGFLGMSTMTNPWDKLAGDRFRSRSLPSTYANWREYGWFNKVLRRAGRVLQAVPNLNTKINILGFFGTSAALPWRKALKVSLLSAADPKASPWIAPLFRGGTRLLNALMRAHLRWQAVPCPFEIYADGIDLVVFEEFGAGAAALHLADEVARNELLQRESYRRDFRRDYERKFTPRVWHRDFHDAHILGCPDGSLVGKSIGQVAEARGLHPCDAFLDLVVAYGKRLRWKTLIANHRPKVLDRLLAAPHVHVGFADSGAHLRNMAFYNFPLRFLKRVKEAEEQGRAFMSLERAVHKLTEEPASWFGVDTGVLAPGRRADLVIVDPAGLDEELERYHEAPIPEFGGMARMVRRNDRAVSATVIGGRVAYEGGHFAPNYTQRRFGRFLRAGVSNRAPLLT